MTVRKNQATLTAEEKRAFTNALVELKRTGVYDRYVGAHNSFLMSDSDSDFGDRVGHRSPSFLPWHRRFLLDFEAALQKVDPKVSLPYWDWTADRTPASSLWAADFLRGTNRARDGQVLDGPFAYAGGKWAVTVGVDGRSYLRRTLGAGGTPNDPVFWMHHAFIDMLWAEWQSRHPKSAYLPAARTPNVVDLHGTMRPWNNVTPADLMDHRKFYTFDTEAPGAKR